VGASTSFDRVRTYAQGIQQEVGTKLHTDTLQVVTHRRNDSLGKSTKRLYDSQTVVDIEETMTEGGGDDDSIHRKSDLNVDIGSQTSLLIHSIYM
jgi:hypothetical protein